MLPHRYPQLPPGAARVILVDVGHNLLSQFSDRAHGYAAQQLRRRGVELRLGVSVQEVGDDHVKLSDDTIIRTHLVVWGGGVSAADVAGAVGVVQGRGGRLAVNPDLTCRVCRTSTRSATWPRSRTGTRSALPQLGSVAQQSGRWAAQNILAGIEGLPAAPFHYRDKGIMAMIGRKAAVAEIGEHRHELHGRIAFAAWLGVHAELLANIGRRAQRLPRMGGGLLRASTPPVRRAARSIHCRQTTHQLEAGVLMARQTEAEKTEPGTGDVLVIFGITGDLARVMTFHSLYRLEKRGLLGLPDRGSRRGSLERG